jgi:hypothetical protein
VARLLELDKLASQQVLYMPSRNRQWHMYACSDRDARAPALKRLFLRGQVRPGAVAGGLGALLGVWGLRFRLLSSYLDLPLRALA